jgi:phosphoribosylaminoimidazole-succinocarboxamide synthase
MLSHDELLQAIPGALNSVDLDNLGDKITGKVRDIYHQDGKYILITSDRVSAFDRVLGVIPFKGQVLNQLSLWWFEQTEDIVANHVIESPDVNVTVAKEAETLPVEVIVRGYITGVTSTAIWTLYSQGDRAPYGTPLPEGLQKNDPLPTPIITPTTKAEGGAHDERLTRDELLDRGLVEEGLWEQVERTALALFARGQQVADSAGLILVDTKYEFGMIDGQLAIIDEIHTPDSSRYWVKESYRAGQTPESFDKEFLRLWFAERGYKGDGEAPVMPDDFVTQVAARYIAAYEKLTGQAFVPGKLPASERIQRNLRHYALKT